MTEWIVSCEVCPWFDITKDKKATEHAGKVHSTRLNPGHKVTETVEYTGPAQVAMKQATAGKRNRISRNVELCFPKPKKYEYIPYYFVRETGSLGESEFAVRICAYCGVIVADSHKTQHAISHKEIIP